MHGDVLGNRCVCLVTALVRAKSSDEEDDEEEDQDDEKPLKPRVVSLTTLRPPLALVLVAPRRSHPRPRRF